MKETYTEWNDDEPFRLSAAMSYYAIFSLPGLLLIVVTTAGYFLGEEAVQGELSNQINGMIGSDAAKSVEGMLTTIHQNQSSGWATIIGVITIVFGATGVFYQLQQSLNEIWEVKTKKDEGIRKIVVDRVTSFGVILIVGFLLLISLVLTAALSLLSNILQRHLPDFLIYVFYLLEFLLSFGIITLLFAAIYKVLPDVKIGWKTVWIGAVVTAALFVLGKFALGFYFGKSDPGSAYGAAGSLILILLWVSYSCLILFFGAEFTKVYARRYGHNIEPSSHAERTASFVLRHQEGQQQTVIKEKGK
ncbi:YihY/virulence factor BrkB family protein [Nafulsella turpanensis]|uniref:YihY/virulence factor BrkB family protein n=1 Tax=Nafulsella turpanensis TaxID=1265690 RepID=UPI001F414D70|nr:YihY/virulence factor BrkB family protein [Nafulsella turpanensis]